MKQPKEKFSVGTKVVCLRWNKETRTLNEYLGTIIGENFRQNTNGGPGTRQYVVRLDDGRVWHFAKKHVKRIETK